MTQHSFQTVLEHSGQPGTWTTFRVPRTVAASFGTKSRVPVKGTINGRRFRSSAMPDGRGGYFVVVNKALQKAAGASPGDRVKVVLERDGAPRELAVPPALSAALRAAPDAARAFEAMAYSRKKEYIDWILDAKRDDTRDRRVKKAVELIRQGLRLKG